MGIFARPWIRVIYGIVVVKPKLRNSGHSVTRGLGRAGAHSRVGGSYYSGERWVLVSVSHEQALR